MKRARTRATAEEGFTLVEAVVALFVLGIIFTALAAAAMGSLRASMTARVEQQAIDFATEALETTRAADYRDLMHVTSDLSGDPRVTTCGATTCYDPGTGTQEPLVQSTTGALSPHVTQVPSSLSNNVSITLSTYVTRPADASADYKRVTVVANWSVAGHDRERAVSSLVTLTTRGLPLPVFKLTPVGGTSASVNPDTWVPFAFEVTNQGAPDRWNLSVTGSAASSWAFYLDDGDGIFEYGTDDVPLTNTNAPADSLVDTGRIDPTASMVFWAVRPVSDSAATGDYWSKLTATSAAQASASTGTASVDLLVRVVDGAVVVDPGGGQQGAAPSAPRNLQLTTGDGQLTATWLAPVSAGSSALSDYVLSYKLSGSPNWTPFADGVSTATTAVVTGLANGSTYDISVAAKNSSDTGASATAQGTPVSGVTYTAPIKCAAASPPPAGSASTGYTLRQYALHNRSAANPAWPGTGVIESTSTLGQGLPLSAAVDGAQVPLNTNLPIYSSDVAATESGRVIRSGGSFSSTDTTRVVDWRATSGGKAYRGKVVLAMWVAPLSVDDPTLPLSMTAELYLRRSNGTLEMAPDSSVVTVDLGANTFGAAGCTGWKEVWMTFDVKQTSSLAADEFIGVRVWNPATGSDGKMTRYRVAYDVVGDFPAYLKVPEKP